MVSLVRLYAKILAEKENINLIIIDGSPGIGCPVILSITGIDVSLLVTEPTISGIHDQALELLRHFNILSLVCINMYDINKNITEKILNFCKDNNIKVVGMIPFNSKVNEAMVNRKTIMEYSPKSDVA
ncbi:MAG: (4Fe-4S)-binding protein, partial [Candidatus Bathyarchaeia archaeon]